MPAGATFRIIVKGVTNPDVSTVMSTWFADVNYNEFSLISHPNFYSISLENPGEYSTLNLTMMSAFPTNAAVYAMYKFVVQPLIKLSMGSQIEIKFPSQYKTIPTMPECSVDGGIKTFAYCSQQLSSIVFSLDTDYAVSQGPIILTIRNILNPDRGNTDAFEVQTTYDSIILEKTDPNVTKGRSLTITAKPSRL